MLENQVIVITGGTRGIGKGVVNLLLQEGAKTIVLAKTRESIGNLEQKLGSSGDLDCYICDITSMNEVSQVINEIYETYGRIDTFINNAGVGVFKPVEDMTEEDWDTQINTNLKGAFLCSQAAYKIMMKGKGGQIINIASDLAYHGREKATIYCASKFGLLGLSQSMNIEGKEYGIRVTTVSPGLVQTDFGGVSAAKKTSGLTIETVAKQILSVIKTGRDAAEVEVIIRP
ncbi:short-chain dehydrogenase [Salipaludibacillus keqinensis]|uniref:Short-chain dehydrogenase n=1 Tax=Salipaludibacillus keqinensis TaxID=2045207 RepID=A0A323TLM8_9BACI|nr:SDR family oxidoreductase [Salipaludibacillus keqinensis]PYZ95006.1 short-chain dehydrogenase [Salipaludibacillus keqinensis]